MDPPFFKKDEKIKNSCYCCATNTGKLSDDHLPPEGIFPKECRNDKLELFTAKICDECKVNQGRKGSDDKDFINHMRLWGLRNQKKLEEYLKKSSSEENKLLIPEFLSAKLPEGNTIMYPVLPGKKQIIVRVLDAVCRGFYYRWTGEIIPKDVYPDLELKPKGHFAELPTAEYNPLLFQNPYIVARGIFEFKPVLFQDEKIRCLYWEFKFYNNIRLPVYYNYDLSYPSEPQSI